MPQPQEVREQPLTPDQAKAYWDELDKQDNGRAPAPADAAASDEPALVEEGTQGGQPKEKPAAEATPPQDDPWAGVNPVVKQHLTDIATQLKTLGTDRLDRIEQALSATVGRVGSIQSQLAKQAEMHKAATAAAASSPDAPTQAQITAAVKDPEKWKRLQADFPEWADGVAEYLETKLAGFQARYDDSGIKKTIEESTGKVSALEQSVATLLKRDEELREMVVEVRHPGWTSTVTTPAFRQWYAAQPPEVRALGASENPLHAIRILDLFSEHRKKAPDPEAIEQDRKRRLEASASVQGSRGVAPTKTWTDEEIRKDPEGYWKYLDELEARQRRDD